MSRRSFVVMAALMAAIPSYAQSFGDILSAILGVAKDVSEVLPAGSESSVGIPQQNLSQWGIEAANYSGITPLGDGRYAVVSDKGDADGFYVWDIAQDPETGKILSVTNEGFFANKLDPVSDRDCEGIVYAPKTGTVFISGEGDQRILEYDMEGQRTGRELQIPEQFGKSAGNQGFEALAFSGRGKRMHFWSTTESTLPSDGPAAGPSAPGVQNMLRIQSFRETLEPAGQYAYKMDAGRSSDFGSTYVFGVPEICSIRGRRLLVLEREANVPKSYLGADVTCKLYSVKLQRSKRISSDTVLADLAEGDFLEKTPVAQWTTALSVPNISWANYEGMCLGAKTSGGKQTLLLISDSQGGYGKGPIRLKDYIKVLVL